MKLTVVLLVTVVFVAMLAMTLFLQQGSPIGDPMPVKAMVPEPVNPAADLEVLVAKTRVEEGTALNPTMFDASTLEEGKIPMGALRKRDLAQINGKFAAKLLQANVPILVSDITDQRPTSLLSIPSGYRAVTINIDNRSGVEGFAKPNTRVDVLFTYTDQGRKKVSTIVRFVKVLSVGGVTAADADKAGAQAAATTITLLVSERDAKKIELARKVGELSLSLVGDQEEPTIDPASEEISFNDLVNNNEQVPVDEQPEEPSNVVYVRDPKTNALTRYVLNKRNKWSLDRSIAENN
jgi:pilus assembly protein CpaB